MATRKKAATKKKITKKTTRKKMTKQKTKPFKKKLLEMKEQLLKKISSIEKDALGGSQKEASGDLSSYTLHMADLATDTYDREFSMNIATEEQKLVYEIDDALRRIKEGEYGICPTCEKLIAQKRLKAIPYAKLCINCQKDEEATKGSKG